MNLEQLRGRLGELVAEMRSLSSAPADHDTEANGEWQMDDAAVERFTVVNAESVTVEAAITDAEARYAAIERSSAVLGGDDAPSNRGVFDTPNQNRAGDPYDLGTLRYDVTPRDLRARAETAIEKDATTDDWVKEAALRTLNAVQDRGQVANLFLHTGSESYRSGFAKLIGGRDWALDDKERQAVARAQSVGTDAAGGFAVPFTLDPTIILTNDSAINPIRELATVKQITTDTWNGVTSAGATASWDAEAAEVSDDAITLAQPSIPVHKMQVFVPFSVEIEGDWAGIQSDLRMAMVDARDRLEATAHIKGTGSGQPTGIEVELDGGSSEVTPATPETFAIADVYNLQRQLPPRYRATADMPAFVAALGTYNEIRQFDTGGGGNLWTQLGGGTPERLLGWRTYEASAADDSVDIDATATEQNWILFVGDWRRYVIVDRVGMTIELVPHLLHTTTNLPKGQRGLIGWLRTGAESIDDNAFRALSIATAA